MSEAKVTNKNSGKKHYRYLGLLQEETGGKPNLRLIHLESRHTSASSS